MAKGQAACSLVWKHRLLAPRESARDGTSGCGIEEQMREGTPYAGTVAGNRAEYACRPPAQHGPHPDERWHAGCRQLALMVVVVVVLLLMCVLCWGA